VVVAPAGYGKTTALAEAVGAAGWDVAWLPCSRSDRDPGRLGSTWSGRFAGRCPVRRTSSPRGSTSPPCYTLVGDEIKAEKILAGRRGTITIRLRGYRVMQTPTTATFRDGWWRVIGATRAYSGLRGGGRPAVASGGADFATRTVSVVHAGKTRRGHGHHHHHGGHGHDSR
jgi:hypothetical protein